MAWEHDGQIPFVTRDGVRHYLTYAHTWQYGEVEWCNNFEFVATLKLEDITRGRSAVHCECTVRTNYAPMPRDTKVNMFLSELERVIMERGIGHGGYMGPAKWTFVKRGSNYSVKLLCE